MGVQNLTGQSIGQYELRELYGMGGMGAVYRAYQRSLEREVAFKVLSLNLTVDPEYIERFNREAKTAASLEHPNIVPVYDYGTVDDVSFVVMRLLTGGSLAERLKQRGGTKVSLGEVSALLVQLASALDYAHSRDVIHRDIKSNNVMFDNHGSAYLVDFGIAKVLKDATSITADGMVMGTPTHMSPEQWRGETPTQATDQYALGVLVYEMLTGKVPFEAPTPYGLMTKHLNEMPTPPQHIRLDIPEVVSAVIERALSKDAKDRFPTVTAFSQTFGSAIKGAEGQASQFFTFRLERKQLAPARSITSELTAKPSVSLEGATVAPSAGFTPAPLAETEPMVKSKPFYQSPLTWIAGLVIVVVLGVLALTVANQSTQQEANQTETAVAMAVQENTATAIGLVAAANTQTAQETVQAQSAIDTNSTVEAQTTTDALATLNAPTATPTATNTPTNTPTVTSSPTPSTPVAFARRSITARIGPGSQYPVADTLEAATTLDIIGISEDGAWYQIILSDGSFGWVAASASLVDISGDINVVPIAIPPTDTPTTTPTETSSPTITPSPTFTPTNTSTPTRIPTNTPTTTPLPTDTPTPTATSERPVVPTSSPTATNTSIEFGETASGVLGRNQQATYTFTGVAGAVISIAVNADFDSILQLYGTDNLALIEDDDSGGNQNPLIDSFTLPRNGEYQLVLRGYAASAQGNFRLSLVEGAYNPLSGDNSIIDYYQTITAYLDRNQEALYTFKGTQGDIISISVQADFDSNLTLEDLQGNSLITDDDSGGSFNPLIEFFTLPTTEEYRIIVRGYSPESLGTYTLTLTKGESEFARTIAINYGDTLTGRLNPGERIAYTFSGRAGEQISALVTSGFDTNLTLRDDQGNLIAQDDDSGGRLQPALTNILLPATGNYVLILDAFSETDEGAFSITVTGR